MRFRCSQSGKPRSARLLTDPVRADPPRTSCGIYGGNHPLSVGTTALSSGTHIRCAVEFAEEFEAPQLRCATAGFERSLPGIAGSNPDLGLLAEWNYYGRDPALAPATIYDNDLFIGARLVPNDIGDTSLLAGALIDADSAARVLTIEGQRRFGEAWVLGLKGQFFTAGTLTDPISAIAADDYFSLMLKRSF